MKIPHLLLLLCFHGLLAAQTRQDYAVFFVVENYDNGWQPLRDAPKEVADIAQQLESNYGFKVKIVKNPTKADIENTLDDYSGSKGKAIQYGPNDQLLLFFSMHGVHAANDAGYLIPRDGNKMNMGIKNWLSHSTLRETAQLMECKHVMVALDACYSGIFGYHKGDIPESPWDRKEDQCAEKLQNAFPAKVLDSNKTRKYVTAGGDERVPIKSVFAQQWLTALRSGGGEDGLIGFNELLGHIEQYRDPRPTYGDFQPGTNGDFIFVKKDGCANKPPQPTVNPYEESLWKSAQNRNDGALYLESFPNGKYAALARNLKTPGTDTAPDLKQNNMVLIPAGTFTMGSTNAEAGEDEKHTHEAYVDKFYLSQYEVTVAEFKAFVEANNNYQTDADTNGGSYCWVNNEWQLKPNTNWKYDAAGNLRPETDYNHPVIHISHNDALAYCQWKSNLTGQTYRLPTEAEWEYAAGNGPKHTKYSWGNQAPAGKQGGNVADETGARVNNWSRTASNIFMDFDDNYAFTAPIGSYNPNDFKLYDMTGNVWEWCSDWYDANYYKNSPKNNPENTVQSSDRVLRGGSWNNVPQYQRVAGRSHGTPGLRNYLIGFRLARTF